jgi:hypothetical protein
MQSISEIKRKLDALKHSDPYFMVFGASTHKYRLNPCLTEPLIMQFEQQYQIALPEDYRRFLTQVGNGGAGPYYGILPLEQSVQLDEPRFLTKPFPHVTAWNLEDSSLSSEEYENEYFRDEYIQGSLHVCHEGCGYYILLVVVGHERGNLWFDGRASDGGVMPIANATTGAPRTRFLEWYEAWLDRKL